MEEKKETGEKIREKEQKDLEKDDREEEEFILPMTPVAKIYVTVERDS